jgi:hypothetical protein
MKRHVFGVCSEAYGKDTGGDKQEKAIREMQNKLREAEKEKTE